MDDKIDVPNSPVPAPVPAPLPNSTPTYPQRVPLKPTKGTEFVVESVDPTKFSS